MSDPYKNVDPATIAAQAEKDLNSHAAKTGKPASDSALESGIDQSVESRFPGAQVKIGGESSGRTIPDSEGGDRNTETGQQTKDKDFEGVGGPEDKRALKEQNDGGST